MDGLFSSLAVSASALTAERLRMNVVAGNLANANSTRTSVAGTPYQRKVAVLAAAPAPSGAVLSSFFGAEQSGLPAGRVEVAAIVADPSPFRRGHDPGHPDADAQGFVRYPNVDPLSEMVDLMGASRVYEANLTAFNTAKTLAQRTLDLGR